MSNVKCHCKTKHQESYTLKSELGAQKKKKYISGTESQHKIDIMMFQSFPSATGNAFEWIQEHCN